MYEPEIPADAETIPAGPPVYDRSDSDKLNELLVLARDLQVRVGTIERESTATRALLDEVVLELVPRIAKLEAAFEKLLPRVKLAEEPCETCPLLKTGE